MRNLARSLCLAVLLSLAACQQPSLRSPGGNQGAPLVQAPQPPWQYIMLAREEGQIIGKIINTADPADRPLAIGFGPAFSDAVSTAKATHSRSRGSGSSADDPVIFNPPADADAELGMTQDHLVWLYPDRRNVRGYLLRNEARRYLEYVVFDTSAGTGALYYDVTRWAQAHKAN